MAQPDCFRQIAMGQVQRQRVFGQALKDGLLGIRSIRWGGFMQDEYGGRPDAAELFYDILNLRQWSLDRDQRFSLQSQRGVGFDGKRPGVGAFTGTEEKDFALTGFAEVVINGLGIPFANRVEREYGALRLRSHTALKREFNGPCPSPPESIAKLSAEAQRRRWSS